MEMLFEIIVIIEAFLIVIFSLIACYYAVRCVITHRSQHKERLHNCCWLTIMQSLLHFLFFLVYFYILVRLLLPNIPPTHPSGFGTIFIRPLVLLNSVVASAYLKMRFITLKNNALARGSREETNAR